MNKKGSYIFGFVIWLILGISLFLWMFPSVSLEFESSNYYYELYYPNGDYVDTCQRKYIQGSTEYFSECLKVDKIRNDGLIVNKIGVDMNGRK